MMNPIPRPSLLALAATCAPLLLCAAGLAWQQRSMPSREVRSQPPPPALPPPFAGTYSITELGTLGGGSSAASGINASGQVVGWATDAGGARHAFLYRDGVMTDLHPAGARDSWTTAVNAAGEVVGQVRTAVGMGAFHFAAGRLQLLARGAGPSTTARALDDKGRVAGCAGTGGATMRAVLYAGRGVEELGTLGGATSQARGISPTGEVVGVSDLPVVVGEGSEAHAFAWKEGIMTDLGTLGGGSSEANAVNASGEVVGCAANSGGLRHAFLYRGGVMADLGTLGGAQSAARAINGAGQVVGWALTAGSAKHAFLFRRGRMKDLNGMILAGSDWVLTCATGINEAGQIVGYGQFRGQQRAFLLTPAPPRDTPAAS